MDIELTIALAALAVALCALVQTWLLWREEHRPEVVAYVRTSSVGNVAGAFDLVVVNDGLRAARDVLLVADRARIAAAMEPNASGPLVDAVFACFSREDAAIPVLRSGEERTNAFGLVSTVSSESTWQYGSRFPIEVSYRDGAGRQFCSNQVLVIRDTLAFAGVRFGNGNG